MTQREIKKQLLKEHPEMAEMAADLDADKVGGKPTIDLDDGAYEDPMSDTFEIDQMMNDLILAEYVDEKDGELKRGGIYLPNAVSTTKAWRTAKVVKVGPKAPSAIQPGTYIRFPSDRGLPTIQGKHKYIFLNADRVFCTLRKKA